MSKFKTFNVITNSEYKELYSGYIVSYMADPKKVSTSDCHSIFVWEAPTEYNYALISLSGTSKKNRRNVMANTEWVHCYAMGNGSDDDDFETPIDHYIYIRWPKWESLPKGDYQIEEYVTENYAHSIYLTVGYLFRNWKKQADFHKMLAKAV